MNDISLPPTTIVVRADDLHRYAWSSTGHCIGRSGLKMIAQYFSAYSWVTALVDLEYELWEWIAGRPKGHGASREQWREFHVEGLILAQRLADLMRPLQISVFYCNHAESSLGRLDIGPL